MSYLNKLNLAFLCVITILFIETSYSQNLNELSDQAKHDVQSLISLHKSKDYDEVIDLAQIYKTKSPKYKNVFDSFIIGAYFELGNYDKVIEYVEPYVLNKEILITQGDAETYLGQAYIEKNRVDEGCALLKEVSNNDTQFKIAYASNCFDSKTYTFSISGRRQDSPVNLTLKEGDVVFMKATGKVAFGMFAGYSGPEGYTNGAYRNYNRTIEFHHGRLFFTTSSDPYLFYDIGYLHLIKSSGTVVFHINDKDVSNNSGMFNATIKVYRQ